MMSDYMGVILAAGKGSRMQPFSENYPKPLLPVCNQALIEYQIRMMRDVGIKEIVVLIGHHGAKIVKRLGTGMGQGVKIKYVEQKSMLGIAHAVGTLEEHILKPFLLFLGDIFFMTSDLTRMFSDFEKKGVSAVLATKIEKNPEAIKRNFAIIESPDGFVKRVIEKPRYIVNSLKGCGLYLFDLHIFDAIRRTPRTAMRDEYELTDSIQILIDDHYKVKKCNIIKEDLNLTHPKDLLELNLHQLKRRGLRQLIGSNVSLKHKNRIVNSIIGDNVIFKYDIAVKNCVIFSDTVVTQATPLENSILYMKKIIQC